MPEEYSGLVAALKTLEAPFAENGWTSRPKGNTYGVVSLDFELNGLTGDDVKVMRAWSGSVDVFSTDKAGEGIPEEVEELLEEFFGASWILNSHEWEQATRLFHWEWTFETA